MAQIGFFVDMAKCVGCKACEIACKNRNKLSAPGPRLRKVRITEEGTFPDVMVHNLSLGCQHCAAPLCMASCPAGAITKSEDEGVVRVDPNKCTGCGACVQACVFNVPELRDDGIMVKCDFCTDRREMGLDPACVQTCFNHALQWGPLEELEKLAEGRTQRKLDDTIEVSVIIVE